MTGRLRRVVIITMGCLWAGACALDSLGYEEDVSDVAQSARNLSLDDDRIADKHPVADSTLTVTESFDSCSFTLNKSGSVTKLSVVPYDGDKQALASALYPNRGAALAALQASSNTDVIPSMETINGRLKPFNDGLYAAFEVAMEDGVAGGFLGKRQLLADILAALAAARPSAGPAGQAVLDSSAAFVGAALILAGEAPSLPAAVLADAQSRAAGFQGLAYYSQPTGFYT